MFVSSLIGVMLISTVAFAQMNEGDGLDRRKSPLSIAKVQHDDTYLKVTYSRPQKEGRTIFGELVPYDKIWRTGANEATEITITRTIQLAGKKVEPGTYALFTVPHKKEWTVILNNDLGQWGAYKYNKSKDYLRVKVPSQQLEESVEAFTINFSKPKNNETKMTLKWDKTGVEVPISFQ
jgi:hypothetical protein